MHSIRFAQVAAKICEWPTGMTPRYLLIAGVLGGIGFTMCLFLTALSFTSPATLAAAKVSILLASIAAAIVGAGLLAIAPGKSTESNVIPAPASS